MILTILILLIIATALLTTKVMSTLKKHDAAHNRAERQIVEMQNRLDALEMQVAMLQGDGQRLQRQILDLGTKLMARKQAEHSTATPRERLSTTETAGGFLGNVIQSGNGYFRELKDHADHTAKFIARPTNESGLISFEPLNFKTLISNDGLDRAVVVTGDLPIDEAGGFGVSKPGSARFDGEKWNILSPCQIYYTR